MGKDTRFRGPTQITCVIDRSGKAHLMTPRQAGVFLMENHRQVSQIHPASTQPFAATAGSGKDSDDE